MGEEIFEDVKKILVAPLNWGLGHATRCIPVINQLLSQGASVSIAGDGESLRLLRYEFPQLPFFELPSYNIRYGTGDSMVFKMILSFPKISKAISLEHEALKEIQKQNRFDAIISDNRYGIWHEETQNVFITHQINIQVPKHLKWLQPILLNYNLKQIANFNECWIPDTEGHINLSGDLSHHCKLPANSYYIGLLSRFFSPQFSVGSGQLDDSNNETLISTIESESAKAKLPTANYELLIILSGPEPQRTIFEKLVLEQLRVTTLKTLIVQGLTKKYEQHQISENVLMISYLTSEMLRQQMESTTLIVNRSGYSSIMDLVACGKKAILVPTPGQTEQEYLADKFRTEGIYFAVRQNEFNLYEAIEKSKSFTGLHLTNDRKSLKERIKKLMS